jgi:hypothetical protein
LPAYFASTLNFVAQAVQRQRTSAMIKHPSRQARVRATTETRQTIINPTSAGCKISGAS